MSAAEDVGAFFCDHDRRCVGVAAGHVRHDRGIDHTQRGDTPHAQIRVDNRAPIVVDAQLACADRMLGDGADPTYEGLEIGIGLDIASRLELLADQSLQGLLVIDPTPGADASDHMLHVRSLFEQVEENARPAAPLVANGPLPNSAQRSTDTAARSKRNWETKAPVRACQPMKRNGCSTKLHPTPGRSTIGVMPWLLSSSAGP